MTKLIHFKHLHHIRKSLQFFARQAHKPPKNPVEVVCPGKPKPLITIDCKVAVITGGSDGIGLCIAHELLSENAQKVALVGIDNCRGRESVLALNSTYGKNKAIFLNCDVQSKIQIQDCYSKVMDEFGKIDIVVNAAGIFSGCDWETEIMTNLMGTIGSMLEAYKRMSKECSGKGGVIVNIAGKYGFKRLHPAPTLAAGQHGVIGLSRSFGHEINFKGTGVRVVTLCPGFTNTNFIKDAEKRALNEKMGNQLKILLQKVKRQSPDACAQAAMHLLKWGASGSVWVVDGSKLYSLKIPNWKTYRCLESQLI